MEYGEESCTDELLYIARYIDTDRYGEVVAPILEGLGLKSMSELYPSFSETALKRRSITKFPLEAIGYEGENKFLGSYMLWDFSAATGTLGWYSGNSCGNLSVLTSDDTRSLTAKMNGGASYADIAYHFPVASDISFISQLEFELVLQSAQNSRYELQLSLIGKDHVVSASDIVAPGDRQALFIDLAQSPELLKNIYNIRLSARPLDTEVEEFDLQIYSFTAHSNLLSSTDLAARISAIQHTVTQREEVPVEQKRDITMPLVVSAVILMASAALIAFLIITNKTRRMSTNKKG
jgi:hypothetical protein